MNKQWLNNYNCSKAKGRRLTSKAVDDIILRYYAVYSESECIASDRHHSKLSKHNHVTSDVFIV